MILGDLGADVIKVEHPNGDDTRRWGPPWVVGPTGRESAYFLCCNRNKRSITADLALEENRGRIQELARSADVLVENFVPGALQRWGLDHDTVSKVNPRLVSCSITGYGAAGPSAHRPGYDFTIQARAGWMAVTGEPDGEPMKVGFALVDVLTGQNAAIAILAALRERERSGRGQRIEVTLIDSALAGLVNVAQGSLAGGETRRYGNAHPNIVPYQLFRTRDRPIVVAVGNDEQWRRLCRVLGKGELAADHRFGTNPSRVENRDSLIPLLQAILGEETAAVWLERLQEAGVPCELVRDVDEALRGGTGREGGQLWKHDGGAGGKIETVGSPLRLQRTPPVPRRPPPELGQHQDEVWTYGWGSTDAGPAHT